MTLMFQKVYDMPAIGLPIHLANASAVDQFLLLSYGACRRIPMTGKTYGRRISDRWDERVGTSTPM